MRNAIKNMIFEIIKRLFRGFRRRMRFMKKKNI